MGRIKNPEAPPNIRINGVVHNAVKRDLLRAREILAAVIAPRARPPDTRGSRGTARARATTVGDMSDSSRPVLTLARSERLERFTAWPVFLASVLFFGATVALLSGSLRSEALSNVARAVAVTCYVVMVLDFLVRMIVARGVRTHFLRRNWFETLSLLVPLLRPFVLIVYLWRLPYFRRSGATLRARLLIITYLFMFLVIYCLSSTVWLVEKDAPGANILSLDDAIWGGSARWQPSDTGISSRSPARAACWPSGSWWGEWRSSARRPRSSSPCSPSRSRIVG